MRQWGYIKHIKEHTEMNEVERQAHRYCNNPKNPAKLQISRIAWYIDHANKLGNVKTVYKLTLRAYRIALKNGLIWDDVDNQLHIAQLGYFRNAYVTSCLTNKHDFFPTLARRKYNPIPNEPFTKEARKKEYKIALNALIISSVGRLYFARH